MKTNNIFVKIAAIASFAILAVACTKPDPTPKPGPDDKPDTPAKVECQQVYFSPDNQTQIILDGETSLVVKVSRKKTDAAISVPVAAVKVSEGISVPESVEFGEKATDAELVIALPADLPVRTVLDLELELTGDHVDAFLSDVSNVYSAKLANPERVRAKATLTNASFTTKEKYGQWAQEIWIMSDTEFILHNFLKSDVDVTLKGVGHDDTYGLTHLAVDSATMGYGDFDEDYEDNTWYFYDDNDGWKSFYPFGEDAWFYLTGCSILYYDEAHITGDAYACYYYDGGTYLYLTCTENYYSDTEKVAYYDQIVLNWTNQEFEEYLPEQQEDTGNTFVAYFESTPDDVTEFTATWGEDGSLIAEDLFYYAPVTFMFQDGKVSSVVGNYVEFCTVDEGPEDEYQFYYYVSDYFANMGAWWNLYFFLDSPDTECNLEEGYIAIDAIGDDGVDFLYDRFIIEIK